VGASRSVGGKEHVVGQKKRMGQGGRGSRFSTDKKKKRKETSGETSWTWPKTPLQDNAVLKEKTDNSIFLVHSFGKRKV